MAITEPGRVTERITLLGRLESDVYLVDGGTESVLLGGSMSYVVPDIVKQVETFDIDVKKIQRLVILHAHFDHVGAVPYLKKQWPWMTVMGSQRARELLAKEKVSQSIELMNRATTERLDATEAVAQLGAEYTGIEVEEAVGEGDRIPCGDLSLKVLEVPGHSSCSIAVYLEEEQALFPSDAAGVRFKEFFLSAGNSNYDLYEQSLEKMAKYEVEVVAAEHYGAYLGQEAREHLPRAMEEAKKARQLFVDSLRRTGDVTRSTEEITDRMVSEAPDYFLSREVLALVTGQMLKYLSKTLDR